MRNTYVYATVLVIYKCFLFIKSACWNYRGKSSNVRTLGRSVGIEPTPAVVVVFRAHATHTMRYFSILFFGCWVMCCCCMGGGDTLCTIPNPSHEKLRKQNALFLFFYGVPLPPPKGTKDQGRKLAPGTGKDIIAHCRAEPSGIHSCHR